MVIATWSLAGRTMTIGTELSPVAQRLLRGHKPDVPAYLSWANGPPRCEADLLAIDTAYAELVEGGLMVPAATPLSVLPGVIRTPFLQADEQSGRAPVALMQTRSRLCFEAAVPGFGMGLARSF
jgi:hypothetical protein